MNFEQITGIFYALPLIVFIITLIVIINSLTIKKLKSNLRILCHLAFLISSYGAITLFTGDLGNGFSNFKYDDSFSEWLKLFDTYFSFLGLGLIVSAITGISYLLFFKKEVCTELLDILGNKK